jgi:hypothetical protein
MSDEEVRGFIIGLGIINAEGYDLAVREAGEVESFHGRPSWFEVLTMSHVAFTFDATSHYELFSCCRSVCEHYVDIEMLDQRPWKLRFKPGQQEYALAEESLPAVNDMFRSLLQNAAMQQRFFFFKAIDTVQPVLFASPEAVRNLCERFQLQAFEMD